MGNQYSRNSDLQVNGEAEIRKKIFANFIPPVKKVKKKVKRLWDILGCEKINHCTTVKLYGIGLLLKEKYVTTRLW